MVTQRLLHLVCNVERETLYTQQHSPFKHALCRSCLIVWTPSSCQSVNYQGLALCPTSLQHPGLSVGLAKSLNPKPFENSIIARYLVVVAVPCSTVVRLLISEFKISDFYTPHCAGIAGYPDSLQHVSDSISFGHRRPPTDHHPPLFI
ncbi:hypothetical protein J6590_032596 [Homalodisca vitripennis]|nr:hypothetical protein J6590_032596 [Homalodisca vitripennis]